MTQHPFQERLEAEGMTVRTGAKAPRADGGDGFSVKLFRGTPRSVLRLLFRLKGRLHAAPGREARRGVPEGR